MAEDRSSAPKMLCAAALLAFGLLVGIEMIFGGASLIAMAQDSPAVVARRLSTAFNLLFDGLAGVGTVSPYESAHISLLV